jgi:hypothetical protein
LSENEKAVDAIIRMVDDYVSHVVKNLSYDITKRGAIKKVSDNNMYTVTIQGTDYAVPSYIDQTFIVHDTVLVLFPQNNLKDGYIIGRAR